MATWAAHVLVSSMAAVFPVFLALDLTPDTTVLFATMMFCSLATVAFTGTSAIATCALAAASQPSDSICGPA